MAGEKKMKNIIFALIIPLFITSVSFSSPIDVLLECDPTPTFKDNYYDGSSKDSVLKTYNGQINDEDWAICEISAALRLAKTEKKEEIKAEALRRSKLIDEDFSISNIGIYKKISVAALDADGVAIRSILIYAKQKMVWVDSASLQDVNAYDPTTDIGWP